MHIGNTESDESSIISKIEAKKNYFKEKWDKVSLDTRKKIFKIYKQDLRTFGYGWDYVTNEIKFET